MTNLTNEQRQELKKKIRDSIPNDESRIHFYGGQRKCRRCAADETRMFEACCYGRDLGLQDVLIALSHRTVGKDKIKVKDHLCAAIDNRGRLFELPINHLKPCVQYDLTKPYQEQSEDFYSFLFSLLCK